jgi:hypothetical protein
LQANYNLMLCYNGLGDQKRAEDYHARYMRFKADESAQALTGSYRLLNPEDNNERQAIHEHVSAPLKSVQKPVVAQKKKKEKYVAQKSRKASGKAVATDSKAAGIGAELGNQ